MIWIWDMDRMRVDPYQKFNLRNHDSNDHKKANNFIAQSLRETMAMFLCFTHVHFLKWMQPSITLWFNSTKVPSLCIKILHGSYLRWPIECLCFPMVIVRLRQFVGNYSKTLIKRFIIMISPKPWGLIVDGG